MSAFTITMAANGGMDRRYCPLKLFTTQSAIKKGRSKFTDLDLQQLQRGARPACSTKKK
ncbi:hypothetical protein [Janthinobacterium agaricidamnosum]|uniref:Uncharacterized protein n=1 Tax=Janthinobacterium agaricidamnosum NBRC 102515 = DSM 9628 TaxID=1349767 RepID=W0VB80_9BURK|nr:hypothetical protein [Janthinobacterium agaricidamnosum]CDG86059.1 hypothetical protein GJA_5463 [Janthinobacterium agaricidamnosum NBRC 102515 = DSM 9628]